ncbi:helix-turn-helix domain-containing protein [Methylobacterium sp. J-072]|uniref:helix-turn-helix domain-containing protein n=1 Tax=Methylobacterium sp. J-072 TaxID=2836651 RepID=UPI001FBBE8C4|nr:helix-turn-helix domain-containing protein [Methylobacterium sp. J-072]MCJ2093248.1 helix-turn-helix domain-containing protein [Methylobacterium sp. J-072]
MRPVGSERKTIGVEEAARWLGVSRNGAYEAAKRGEIPTINIGRLKRVPIAPFERLLGLSVSTGKEDA